MNYKKILAALAVVVAASLFVCSCSDDDSSSGDNGYPSELIGTWSLDSEKKYSSTGDLLYSVDGGEYYIRLCEDGSCWFYEPGEDDDWVYDGTFVYVDGVISFVYDVDDIEYATVSELTSSKLVLKYIDTPSYFVEEYHKVTDDDDDYIASSETETSSEPELLSAIANYHGSFTRNGTKYIEHTLFLNSYDETSKEMVGVLFYQYKFDLLSTTISTVSIPEGTYTISDTGNNLIYLGHNWSKYNEFYYDDSGDWTKLVGETAYLTSGSITVSLSDTIYTFSGTVTDDTGTVHKIYYHGEIEYRK